MARTDDRTGLSHVCLHTAVCIGLLASCDMRAGVVWLESANRRGKAWREDLSSAEVLQRLQHFFMEADLDFLDELRDPTRTSLSAAAFATAARAAEEYKLGGWVRAQNLDGTSIRTARLIVEYQRRIAEQPPSVPLRSAPWIINSTGRNWAFRWRRSQGAMFGKLRTEADVTLPEKREKARGCVVTQWELMPVGRGGVPQHSCHRLRLWGPSGISSGAILCPTFWAMCWVHIRRNPKCSHNYQISGGQKTDHVLTPLLVLF